MKITAEYIKNYIEKLTEQDLSDKSRKRDLVNSRIVAFKLTRTFTNNSLSKIGKIYGGKDHATVLHNVNLFDTLKEDKKFQKYFDIYDHCFDYFMEVSDSEVTPRKVVRKSDKVNLKLKLNAAQELLTDIPKDKMKELVELITLKKKSWAWKSKDTLTVYQGAY